MSFTFREAKRENVPLLIGLAGGTGSGKTYSAMSLAKGLAGGKKFVVIDTENGRALHYADEFSFDHGDLRAPFTPKAYADAIQAADAAGYPVIVVDSFSHEHAGEGGLLDMHEAEYQRMGAREAVKMTAWIKPKTEHKAMVSRLLQVRAHVILCMRAEEKIEIVKNAQGKTEVRPKQSLVGLDGWIPVCEKNVPYELTLSFLLTAGQPGFPKPIKLQSQHRPFFPLDKQVGEETGKLLAQWAAGGATSSAADGRVKPVSDTGTPAAGEPLAGASGDSPLAAEISAATDALIGMLADSDAAQVAIEKNAKTHADDLGKHLAWLKQQLVRAQAAAEKASEPVAESPAEPQTELSFERRAQLAQERRDALEVSQ